MALFPRFLTCFLVLIILCNNYFVSASERGYIRLTTEQGLAGNNVYSIIQDNIGYLWIATETGLSRFDGNTFKNFTVKEGLPGNDINMLMTDQQGRLWISPFKKEICYYSNGKIYNKYNSALVRQLKVNSENKVFSEDEAGNILFADNDQLILIDTNNQLHYLPLNYSGKGFFIPKQLFNPLPLKVIHTSLSAYKIRLESHPFLKEWYNALPAPNAKFYYSHNQQHLYLFRNNSTDTIQLPFNRTSVSLYNDTLFIINTLTGSYLYNINSGRPTDTLLNNVSINNSFTDKEGNIWLGTKGRGLYYFPAVSCYNTKRLPGNLPVHTYHFYEYKKQIIAGLNNWQLWPLDTAKKIPERKLNLKQTGLELLSVSGGNIQTNAHHSIIERLISEKKIDSIAGVKSFMSVGDTLITANLKGQIHRVSLKTGKIIDSLNTGVRLTCAYYKDGVYYTGTTDGLYLIDRQHPRINFEQKIVPGPINGIAFSEHYNLLWIITREQGVYCLRDNKIIYHFNEKNGLSSDISNCIFLKDDQAYIGTVKGITQISIKEQFKMRIYDTRDGLLSNDINCIYATENRVIAGSPEGISFLSTASRDTPYLCRIHLDEIIVSGSKTDTNTTLILDKNNNNILFKYSGISFRSMGKLSYTYRLSGLDEQWHTTDQNYLSYPALPPGKYTLELYATDRFQTNSPVSRFTFYIKKAWWMHWWVQLSGFILLSGILAIIIWWRMSRLRKKERERMELQQKIIALEQLALRAQMNPHFIFNSLNSFYQYIISQDLSGASKFISDFSRLIRLLFETTPLNEITLDKEIEFLSTYLEIERVKLDDIFSYEFIIQDDLITEEFMIPSFILQPFVENAIRHGIQNRSDKNGTIKISIVTEDNKLVIRINDNGAGRAFSEKLKLNTVRIHHSRGIALTKERITLYNQSQHTDIRFYIEDEYKGGTANGTTVIFHFPINDIR